MIGQKLLHYEIIEKLGEGGMGEVYLARDSKLGRDVALKILPEDMCRSPERRARFEREARVVAALNHPNIVTIHSVDEAEGRHFLTMELVRGKTIRELIPPEGMSLGTFFSLAIPLVDAMCSAHAQGITHRDLKPSNVMVSDEGRLKVLDFGLAKLVQEAQSTDDARTIDVNNTRTGEVLGTVSYMSPEQVEGKPLDGRTDIFSLGVMFYEMLTGRRPFAGDSHASTISAILRDTPPSVSEIRRTLPRHLGRIVRRCLSKDPDRRYQTPMDLRNDLRELAEEVDSGELDVASGGAADPSSGAADPSSAATSRPPEDSSRPPSSDSIVLPGTRRTYGWVLGLAAVAAVVVVAVTMLRGGSSESPDSSATVTAAAHENATVGVIGFENLTDPEDSENLGRVLMGLVTTGLAESGGLEVASTAKVMAARRQVGEEGPGFDASLAAAAAEDAGADVMLTGQVIQSGDRIILTAELVDVGSGNTIGSLKKEGGSSAELFEIAGAIAHDVRDLLGVGAAQTAADEVDLAQSLTDSPEAYRQFTAGEIAVHQGNYDQAVELYGQAIRLDPTFALAYLKIQLAYTWNGETDKGLEAAKNGLQYIDRLPERWQTVYRASIDYYEGDAGASYEKMSRLVVESPDIPDAYNLLGEIRTHFSKYQDVRRACEYLERALEIDPTFEVVLFHLVQDHILRNDPAALEDLIATYRAKNPSDPRIVSMELTYLLSQEKCDEVISRVDAMLHEGDTSEWMRMASALQLEGKWDRAFDLCEKAIERDTKGYNMAFAYNARGTSQIGRGNIEAGLADFDRASSMLTGMGAPGRWAAAIVASYRWHQAQVLIAAGDFDGAEAKARRGIEEDPQATSVYVALVRAQIGEGRLEDAERSLRKMKELRDGNLNPSDDSRVAVAEAELELARGNPVASLAILNRASQGPIESRSQWNEWLVKARAQSATGDLQGAIASFNKILHPTILVDYFFDMATFRIPIHYELARVYEQAGQPAEARKHYQAYLDCWGDTDRPVPNADDARARLQAL